MQHLPVQLTVIPGLDADLQSSFPQTRGQKVNFAVCQLQETSSAVSIQWLKRKGDEAMGEVKMDIPVGLGKAAVAAVGALANRTFRVYGCAYGTDMAFFW